MFALFVHDPRFDLPCAVQFAEEPIGHDDLDWRDVSAVSGFALGWLARADGTFGPHVPDLDDVRALRLRDLKCDCRNAIAGGFASAALGAEYRYGSGDTDQANLAHDALDADAADAKWRAQVWCADAAGAWSRRAHDAKQVAKVFSDFRAMRADAQEKLVTLLERVATANSVAIVQAVTWG